MAKTMAKGSNSALVEADVSLDVSAARGTELDVSALLLGADKKVRSDKDLVFYNNPAHGGVSVSGLVVTARLKAVPADVDFVVIVASADPDHPGTVFAVAPSLTITQNGAGSLSFTPPDFVARETVVVMAELYRRNGGWKVRAVGQGYASGLAGLATDYGVQIDDGATASGPAGPKPAATRPDVNLTKVQSRAPALVGPAEQAGQALSNAGIVGRRAAVYLILAHDYDMQVLYESFAIQAFAERVLALSAVLDDDGTVPVVFSGEPEPFLEDINLDNYRGRIGNLHTQVDWGWGYTVEAMRRVVNHYQSSGATDPAFIIVQVSDEPHDKAEIRSLLQNTASLGVFWLFVGFGQGRLAFFKNLDASTSANFDNAAFHQVGKNPGAVPSEAFYSGLVDKFAGWLR